MNVELGFIYYLQNPQTGEIFYIGSTTTSLNNRLRTHYQHLLEFEKGLRKTNKRYEYLSKLRPIKARIHLLEIITIENNIEKREIFYINKFKEINPNLTNMTDGGRGGWTSKYYTEQQIEKQSQLISKANKGKKKPEGFGLNMSLARIGINNPAATPIINNGIIMTKDRINFYWFKYGFQINTFLNKKDSYGNIFKTVTGQLLSSNKPYGYECKFFNKASKRVQDIVQSQYESIE